MKGTDVKMLRRFFSLIIILSLCFVLSTSSIYQQLGKNDNEPDMVSPIKGEEGQLLDLETAPRNKEPLNTKQDVEQQVAEKTTDQDEFQQKIVISLAGDCTLGTDESFSYVNSFPYQVKKQNEDWGYFFAGVKDIFENDDLTLVNLETTFTTAKKKAKKTFRFKGDPSYVNILKEGSVEMVNIANNHIYDYLQKGFDYTIETLEQAGILYSGEGHIAFFETKGITIASLGYCGWSTSIKDQVKRDIEDVRAKADLVIVSFHWGKDRSNYPNEIQKELGRFAIDQGADLVAGHHPHVIQGIEKYQGRYIVYSLGNFCFGGNRNPKDKDTFIFQNEFIFRDGQLKESQCKIIPCRISSVTHVNDYQPTVLEGEEAQRVMNRILKYSSSLEYAFTEE